MFVILVLFCILYILDINPLSDVLMNIFSHSVVCLFILLQISFAVQEIVCLIRSCLFIFSFVSFAWGDISNVKFLQAMSKILLPVFFLGFL